MGRARSIDFGLLAVALVAGPALGQAPDVPAQTAGLEQEIRTLNSTLAELVVLLRQQLSSHNAGVLMQRVQLMSSRIAPLEEELRGARSEERGLEGELERLEHSAQLMEAQFADWVEGAGLDDEREREMERMREDFRGRRKQLRDQLLGTQARVAELDRRLAGRRAEIETWEMEIDRALGLR